MRAKYLVIGVVVGMLASSAVVVLTSSAVVVLAGNLDPSSGPTDAASQMVTLEQIYQRLHDGTAATKMTSFTEPASGPGTGTMHTLDEIYDLIGAPASVPKTGQTVSYGDRDDGELEMGIAWPDPRFTDNLDDTVTDNLTGLMWTRNADHGAKKWYDSIAGDYPALEYCNDLTLAGYDDWRLPNIRELHSLIDFSQYGPATPGVHPFAGVQDNYYWSSTTFAGSTFRAWRVYLGASGVSHDDKAGAYYVWPVRGGQ